jgi:Co/Zn/Cd efflux system component
MGIVGAVLIGRWAIGLLRDSGGILLDHDPNPALAAEIREHVESDRDSKIADLHIWKVADDRCACILSVVSAKGRLPEYYKRKLKGIPELAHVTVEINRCERK